MSEWIFYKDRVPEKNEKCWVCRFDNTITEAEYQNYHEIFGSGFGNYEEFIKEKYVKAWMPYFTPESPKDDE